MNTAETIRQAVAEVQALRRESVHAPGIAAAVSRVKRFQARRFAATYADLLAAGPTSAAARFFLEELYGERDYAERDAQFARIAGAVEKLFPQDVAETAAALAALHALTEALDHALARALPGDAPDDVAAYVRAWKEVGRRTERARQLETVMAIGAELTRLTRLPGLRMMLRVMRRPAAAAGMAALQQFLETGFDTFAAVTRVRGGAEHFLATIEQRERALMQLLFEAGPVACETELRRLLGQAP